MDCGDQGDQVVRAEREGRVVERAGLLGDPLGFAAHLDDQGLGGQPQLLGRGDAERASGQPLHVDGRAGEGHRRVQRERQRAGAQRGVEHLRAVPPRGVHEQLSRAHGTGLGEAVDEAGQGVVGHGQQDEVGAREHLVRANQRHVGQQRAARRRRGVRDPGDGDRAVPGELEGGGQGGPDAARADDADGEASGAVPAGSWLGVGMYSRDAGLPVPVRWGYRTISRHVNAIGPRRLFRYPQAVDQPGPPTSHRAPCGNRVRGARPAGPCA